MNYDTLLNKEGLWSSDDEWIFNQTKNGLIYIENISKAKRLGTTNDSKVILEDLKEDRAGQLWKKGERNADGYFTLENHKVPKIMTAISPDSLEIQGNITFRCISSLKNNF